MMGPNARSTQGVKIQVSAIASRGEKSAMSTTRQPSDVSSFRPAGDRQPRPSLRPRMVRRVPLPRTLKLGDTEVSRIGLGTNRLTTTSETVTFIREAVAAGVRHIDTAHLYTGGESEAAIGAALSPIPD